MKGRGFSRAARGSFSICHPERALPCGFAAGQRESKDPYSLKSLEDAHGDLHASALVKSETVGSAFSSHDRDRKARTRTQSKRRCQSQ